jgi:L-ascorbate metabolism protein UlaG (beta-lactamase superfamily)
MSRVLFRAALVAVLLAAAPAFAQDAALIRLAPAAPEDAKGDRGSVFFVGTATVIIRYAGFTILTDPNFLHKGDHVHLGYGLESERLTNPAIELDKLPPIDAVVLSHYHEDHFDKDVEARMDKRTLVVTTPEAAKHLQDHGFTNVQATGKWQSVEFAKGDARLRITAMPARHGPPVMNHALPETMGSMLEFQPVAGTTSYRMYISGDTLVYDELPQIPKRYPNIDLALLHLGGTRAAGVLVTMDAEQGVQAIRIINPGLAIPIHYDDYDVFKSPLEDFIAAVKMAGLGNKVQILAHGDTFDFRVPEARLRR